MTSLEKRIANAVRYFWKTRSAQQKKQAGSGRKDQGDRGAVTGGGQLDGFTNLISDLVVESGFPKGSIIRDKNVELPGFFRPTKEWDLLIVADGHLLASLELKSHIGPSFGNNYNNRTEEALGSATDIWTAYREGAFNASQRPWLGYFMLLEDAPRSRTPVSVREPNFRVFEEFRGASYAKRYEILCLKLLRERLYDAACFLTSSRDEGKKGSYAEPSEELSFRTLLTSLVGRLMAFKRLAR